MQIYRTGAVNTGYVNILVYGLAGSGKTPLAATCPDCLVITSEPGLLSLRRANLPYVLGRNYKEAMEVFAWANGSSEARKYNSLFYDSISATSENVLQDQMKRSRDRRQYSPETFRETMEVVKAFQGIENKHVIMTCKALEVLEDVPVPQGLWKPGETNAPTQVKKVEPFAVVPKLGPALPYNFDEVFYLSRHVASDGSEYAAFRCRENDFAKYTRDRSGLLGLWEPADFSHIIKKINGV